MHPSIRISIESERGCGYRKVGGLYLRYDGPAMSCGRLPIPLTVCPCCGHGFKPSRGFTWVNADQLIEAAPNNCISDNCLYCPIGGMIANGIGRAGLIWIGEEFYKTPLDFEREAARSGISRRIAAVPNDFEIGKTWIMLAHRKVILNPVEFGKEPTYTAGIFRIFKPDRIEVVVDGTESDELIESYLARKLTPVLVKHQEETVSVPTLIKVS